MIARIRAFFEQHLVLPDTRQNDSEHALRLAAAALLLEMTRMSHEVTSEESAAVTEAVREHMDLSPDESEELILCAEAERADATDYYQFTSLINQSYSPEQKAHLVEMLWRIAYADDSLHMYEEHLVRKVADLLYVPHRVFIAAKHRAGGDR
ncbi:MAG: TerB family tellurite resistance protein [Pseudomonadota bacterium]|nr:TerB family tellurite resistance protein [Pseudomonadota bacterium]